MIQESIQQSGDGEDAPDDGAEGSEEVEEGFATLADLHHHRRKLVHEKDARQAGVTGEEGDLLLVLRYRILEAGGEEGVCACACVRACVRAVTQLVSHCNTIGQSL